MLTASAYICMTRDCLLGLPAARRVHLVLLSHAMLTASASICVIRECMLSLPTDRRGALHLLLKVPLLSRRTQPTSSEVG